MRVLILIICAITVGCDNLFSQPANDYFQMVNISFLKYLDKNTEYEAKGIIRTSDYHDTYILTDNYPLNFRFSSEIAEKGFKYISFQKIKKRELRRSKHIIAYSGPFIKGDSIVIRFSDWSAKYTNKRLHIIVGSSWVDYTWQYVKEEELWKISKVEYGGI